MRRPDQMPSSIEPCLLCGRPHRREACRARKGECLFCSRRCWILTTRLLWQALRSRKIDFIFDEYRQGRELDGPRKGSMCARNFSSATRGERESIEHLSVR
jgi:hypothetical protein